MKYGFLGAGNMGSAIIKGMLKGGFDSKKIFVYDLSKSKLDLLSDECGIKKLKSEEEVFECDIVVIAIKPTILDENKMKIKEMISKLPKNPKFFISIVVGKSLHYLSEIFEKTPIARVMTNVNAMTGSATTGYCLNEYATKEEEKLVTDIFSTLGIITPVEENSFSVFSAIAGSSPAFCYMFIDALARAAVRGGIPKPLATKIAAHTVFGSANMVLSSDKHPMELCDMVCSPAGTTIQGVCSLQKDGFEASIHNAIKAVMQRDCEIGG
ncbi:MAG: pyrroline-5-carboxylate reductase [Synergistaceae bacterium]|nr:pyrroline-5-carboxylate reductase [Synergistaceae bacterium]